MNCSRWRRRLHGVVQIPGSFWVDPIHDYRGLELKGLLRAGEKVRFRCVAHRMFAGGHPADGHPVTIM